ncbi:MAG: redox-sensing transcriptional repressor Rex [Ruminococcaceae bacterium]|nr:redox-sensing transcriptional repressor Rex [Oscillospiraceae bacterium]
MKSDKKISVPVLRRLPKYYRHLEELSRQGIEKISSKDLSKLINVTASQIRQDLNCFGGFGQQGYGYNVKSLRDSLAEILGVTKRYTAIIVGVGHLGQALANHTTLSRSGVDLISLFDISSEVVGSEVAGHVVKNISQAHRFCQENQVDIAILTLPKSEAVTVANLLSDAGVKGFWNFANTELTLKNKEASVENVYMGDSLMKLCYDISDKGQSL